MMRICLMKVDLPDSPVPVEMRGEIQIRQISSRSFHKSLKVEHVIDKMRPAPRAIDYVNVHIDTIACDRILTVAIGLRKSNGAMM